MLRLVSFVPIGITLISKIAIIYLLQKLSSKSLPVIEKYHHVDVLSTNECESSEKLLHALSITQISKDDYRDFGTFPEISVWFKNGFLFPLIVV
jgi:hypothetical protein